MAYLNAITGQTTVVGLIGTPVRHSMSPAMHNAAFEKLGLDFVYVVFDVQPEDLEAAVKGLKAMGVAGYQVTMPHKTTVLPHLDELSPIASMMGAVNTVVLRDGVLVGENTDGAGFMRALKQHDIDVIGKKITILGAGGAGSAIYTQAALDGVSEISIFNIKDQFFDRAVESAAMTADRTGAKITVYDLDDRDELRDQVAASALVVNATRVGMAPLEDEAGLDESMLHDDLVVADTVYSPRKTKLITMAEERGLKTVPGVWMLIWQAAIAEELWTGVEMPVLHIEKTFFR